MNKKLIYRIIWFLLIRLPSCIWIFIPYLHDSVNEWKFLIIFPVSVVLWLLVWVLAISYANEIDTRTKKQKLIDIWKAIADNELDRIDLMKEFEQLNKWN